jgi:hypothetical protein
MILIFSSFLCSILSERADLKITVYHKSSIIDEFIGRASIDVSDMFNENNRSLTRWFRLHGKSESSTSETSKKPEKNRGEIEVRVDFIVKPKAGSMMDLSMKSNDKTGLSLRDLKQKPGSFKVSLGLGDKLRSLNKSRKDKLGHADNSVTIHKISFASALNF